MTSRFARCVRKEVIYFVNVLLQRKNALIAVAHIARWPWPARSEKNIIRTKRLEKSSYAGKVIGNSSVTAPNTPSIPFQQISNQLSSLNVAEVVSKSATCVIIAALKCREKDTNFETVMNELLVANGLSTFSMGGVTPPQMVLEPAVTTVNRVGSITTDTNDNANPTAALHLFHHECLMMVIYQLPFQR